MWEEDGSNHLCSLPGSPEQQPGPEGPGRPTAQWGGGRRNSAFDEPEAVGSPTAPSLAVPPSPTTAAAAVHAASPFSSGTWEGWSRAPFPWRLRTLCSHRHFLCENAPQCWKQPEQMNAGALLWAWGCWPGPASSGLTKLRKKIPGPPHGRNRLGRLPWQRSHKSNGCLPEHAHAHFLPPRTQWFSNQHNFKSIPAA